MKQNLSLFSRIEPFQLAPLAEITAFLRERRLVPHFLVWSASEGTPFASLLLEVEIDDAGLQELAARCRRLPAVISVRAGATADLPGCLVAGRESPRPRIDYESGAQI